MRPGGWFPRHHLQGSREISGFNKLDFSAENLKLPYSVISRSFSAAHCVSKCNRTPDAAAMPKAMNYDSGSCVASGSGAADTTWCMNTCGSDDCPESNGLCKCGPEAAKEAKAAAEASATAWPASAMAPVEALQKFHKSLPALFLPFANGL